MGPVSSHSLRIAPVFYAIQVDHWKHILLTQKKQQSKFG